MLPNKWPKRIAYFIVYFLLLTGLFLVFTNSVPYNPLTTNSFNTQTILTSFFPEGWGFFSKNPRDPRILIYKLKNGIWYYNDLAPISSYRNVFGLGRRPRAQSTDMAMIMQELDDSLWHPFESPIAGMTLDRTQKIINVVLETPDPTLQDTVCFKMAYPLPWAWRKYETVNNPKDKFIFINVKSSR
jgi:antimicrobial peptide system SdpA family protein